MTYRQNQFVPCDKCRETLAHASNQLANAKLDLDERAKKLQWVTNKHARARALGRAITACGAAIGVGIGAPAGAAAHLSDAQGAVTFFAIMAVALGVSGFFGALFYLVTRFDGLDRP